MSLLTETRLQTPDTDSDQDFENCKGRCGYTPWCRACREEREQMEKNAVQKEDHHVD